MPKFYALMFVFLVAAPALKAADHNVTVPQGHVYVGPHAVLVLPEATLEKLLLDKERGVLISAHARVMTEEHAARKIAHCLTGAAIGTVFGATMAAIFLGKNNNEK